MLSKVMPAVVNVINQGQLKLTKDPFLKQQLLHFKGYKFLNNKRFISMGSGVIIDAKRGLIVTNAHVIDLAKNITITLKDGRHFKAKKIGVDDSTDIALLQIHATNLSELPLSDSDTLKIGDPVVTIGSPFGLTQTVTGGIVSALHRNQIGLEGFENFIQTDAPINRGNSGGALVSAHGQLMGINTALITSSRNGGNIGIGFAIPSNMVKSVVDQLLKYGNVKRGMMGVLVQNLTPNLAEAFKVSGEKGALISQVMSGTPAQRSGLLAGDIITAINGKTVKSSSDLHNFINLLRVNSPIKLDVLRHGKKQEISSVIVDSKKGKDETAHKPFLSGVKLENVTQQIPLHGYVEGVQILNVDRYSSAFISGLRPEDIITAVNHHHITNIKQLESVSNLNKDSLLLDILRGKNANYIVIK